MTKTTPNLEAVRQAVEVLNEALLNDRHAIEALFAHRVPATEALANHPTIQVLFNPIGNPTLGTLGLINGLFGVDDQGWGLIAAIVDEKNQSRIERFIVREPKPTP